MTTDIAISKGTWFVDTSSGLNIIKTSEDKQLAIVEEIHDAALLGSAKIIFESLVEISDLIPQIENPQLREAMEEIASTAFEKLLAEVS